MSLTPPIQVCRLGPETQPRFVVWGPPPNGTGGAAPSKPPNRNCVSQIGRRITGRRRVRNHVQHEPEDGRPECVKLRTRSSDAQCVELGVRLGGVGGAASLPPQVVVWGPDPKRPPWLTGLPERSRSEAEAE